MLTPELLGSDFTRAAWLVRYGFLEDEWSFATIHALLDDGLCSLAHLAQWCGVLEKVQRIVASWRQDDADAWDLPLRQRERRRRELRDDYIHKMAELLWEAVEAKLPEGKHETRRSRCAN
jgi:hypothetical protein